MEREKVSTFAAKFKKAFSEGLLNELGKGTRYCHRVRQLTPYRMVMTLMTLFAGTQVESLADLQRGFNALFGYTMDTSPSTTNWPNGRSPCSCARRRVGFWRRW
jgi:hypothetical protein